MEALNGGNNHFLHGMKLPASGTEYALPSPSFETSITIGVPHKTVVSTPLVGKDR